MVRQHAARPRGAGHRVAQQRALCRAAGVEPPASGAQPGDRAQGLAHQSAGGVGRRRGPSPPHPGRRSVAGGEGPTGRVGGEIRGRDRGRQARPCEPDERDPPAAPLAVGASRMRRLRRRLRETGPGPLCLLEPRKDRRLHQPKEYPPCRPGGTGAGRAEAPADGAGGGGRGDPGLCRGNQPPQPGAPRLGGRGQEGARGDRKEDRDDDRGDRGRRLCARHVGPAARAGGPPGRARRTPRGRPGRFSGHPSERSRNLPPQGGAARRRAEAPGGPRRGGDGDPGLDRAHRAGTGREVGRGACHAARGPQDDPRMDRDRGRQEPGRNLAARIVGLG